MTPKLGELKTKLYLHTSLNYILGFLTQKFIETEIEHGKNFQYFPFLMWGKSDVRTLALTVTKTSSHYDRSAISVPARSLLLFDLA